MQDKNIVKIYSRPRLCKSNINQDKDKKIRYQKAKNYKNNYFIIKVMVVIIIATITAINILRAINPIIDQLCINETKNRITKTLNLKSSEIMQQYGYNDFVNITRDNNNNITMIQANTNTINEVSGEITDSIINEIENNPDNNISIYLGSIFGIKILAATGPKINAKITCTGNISTNIKSEFNSAGINQTLHRIYLEVKLNIKILTPYNILTTEISSPILLAESIIVGNVPSSYYNLNNPTNGDIIKSTNK